jgi:hypothetical protein
MKGRKEKYKRKGKEKKERKERKENANNRNCKINASRSIITDSSKREKKIHTYNYSSTYISCSVCSICM